MDSPPGMILPKGLVVNTQEVYEEVASFPVVPSDKIVEYWKVYTTTNTQLQDPTARRLENFWWQVWGSDRRQLSGRTLARLYEDISTGPTVVPLRGPPNRWEGPDVPPMIRQLIDSIRSGTTPSTAVEDDDIVIVSPAPKQLFSAERPAPSHTILKKPRGPSSSGPRPTARFVSPLGSPDDIDKDAEIPSSASTITPSLETKGLGIRVPSKKKAGTGSRRIVVSAGASKRRPVLTRKNSSQSSNTSDQGSKDGSLSAGSRSPRIVTRPVSPIAETLGKHVGDVGEHQSVGSHEPAKPSAKALGKRPMMSRSASADKKGLSKRDARQPKGREELKQPSPATIIENVGPCTLDEILESPLVTKESTVSSAGKMETGKEIPLKTTKPLRANRPSELQTTLDAPPPFDGKAALARAQSMISIPSHSQTNAILPDLPSSVENKGSITPRATPRPTSMAMAKSRSHSGYDRRRPNQGLFTGAIASTSNVAAQGTILDQSGVGSLPPSPFFDQRHLGSESSSTSSLLEPRQMPTQPSAAASAPLARTRSQLTLLLEREKDRTGGRPRKS